MAIKNKKANLDVVYGDIYDPIDPDEYDHGWTALHTATAKNYSVSWGDLGGSRLSQLQIKVVSATVSSFPEIQHLPEHGRHRVCIHGGPLPKVVKARWVSGDLLDSLPSPVDGEGGWDRVGDYWIHREAKAMEYEVRSGDDFPDDCI